MNPKHEPRLARLRGQLEVVRRDLTSLSPAMFEAKRGSAVAREAAAKQLERCAQVWSRCLGAVVIYSCYRQESR